MTIQFHDHLSVFSEMKLSGHPHHDYSRNKKLCDAVFNEFRGGYHIIQNYIVPGYAFHDQDFLYLAMQEKK